MLAFRLLFVLSLVFFASFSQAKEVTVFDVRRPLAMSNTEDPPKDYYINGGSNDGLKVGMTVKVNRRTALYDQYQNKSPGDLVVSVGQLHIIHVQEDISVARLEKIDSRANIPTIEFDAIMMGDKVDLTSAKMKPLKTAALIEPKQNEIAAMPDEPMFTVPLLLPVATPEPTVR